MEFYTVHKTKRPVMLDEKTRLFAWNSMQGEYGDKTMCTMDVCLDNLPEFLTYSDYEKYDAAIEKIATEAPLRICEEERISGSATLGSATLHLVPAKYNGKHLWGGVSHVTLGFNKVLHLGIDQIEKEINKSLLKIQSNNYNREVLVSLKNTVTSFRIWHKRYLEALKDTKQDIYLLLLQVPFHPPRNFHEAVQSLWFTFTFTRLCGNWSGIGRIDEMLGSYLKTDLSEGTLTLDEAREILASFFIKGCEWIRKDMPTGSGDAQYYQNIILSGIDYSGKEVTNEVTYLVLDIIEELGISEFPVSIRINKDSPSKLLKRAAEVIRHGGGIIAFYNEQLVIDSLIGFGYPLHEALCFANDGCWEVQIPGKTNFSYIPFDGLQILLNDTLELNKSYSNIDFKDYEELYKTYLENMNLKIEEIYNRAIYGLVKTDENKTYKWKAVTPCSVVSLFTDDCIARGLPYLEGGAKYTVVSPHLGGAADVGNSLYAIKKLVFEDKKVSLQKLMGILRNNWDGYEELKAYARFKYEYYGNDNDESDAIITQVLSDFAKMVERLNGRTTILFPPGISTFGRQIEWAPKRQATPFGFKRGEVLSGNSSPTPGTDANGATAMIKSYCKTDPGKQVCGTALDLKLFPATVQGDNGVTVIKDLLLGFISLGGFFIQLDIVDHKVLREAQKHPEKYKTLSVRVSGWNARFVSLDKEWQEMIINRTEQGAQS